ncbi:MFS transporter permease [Tsukamurella pseudospumae]|uniref:MFS transporter permease n=1 Tax=Tsukamurella pseudospumae TaxID=239498 RepID=A0A138A432_9ACTN|nr:MFS transporter [Tsukamurella pseudospumae]KXP05199.1 MFS transporter permease [Tsukamurella pseudospumae]
MTSTVTAPGDSGALAPGASRRNHPLVTVVILCFGGMVAALMQSLVIPIQPELPQLLNTSSANASWVITATLLAAAVAMPIGGRLADMIGKRRVLVLSAVLLVAGSLAAALSTGLVLMLVGRVLQGLAMAFIPVGISMMREVTPPSMTATAVAAMSATLGVGGAIGLPLSAWIAQTYDWHMLFWVSTVLAGLILAAVLFVLPDGAPGVGGRIDVIGSIGLAVGLVATLVAVTKGNDWGWTSGSTLGLLIGGLAVLVAWGFFELRHADPLVDLRTSARPRVLITNIATVTIGFGMMAMMLCVPQIMEFPTATGFGLGKSMLEAGLWMMPGGIMMMMIFAPVSSILIKKVGPAVTLAIGAFVVAGGYVLAFFLMDAAWKLSLASIVGTVGVAIAYAAMPTIIMTSVPQSETGAAIGLNALMRSLGTTICSAVAAAIISSKSVTMAGHVIPTQGAFETIFVVAAVAALLAGVIALMIPKPKVAEASE